MVNEFLSLVAESGINVKESLLRKLREIGDNEDLVIKAFESECKSNLFKYKVMFDRVSSNSKILSSFVIIHDNDYKFIKYVNGYYYSNEGLVDLNKFDGYRYFYIREIVKISEPKEIMYEIINFTPTWSMLLLLLTPFALVTPLYTNIFNTRIIHSNNVSTLAIVSIVFLLAYLFEFFSKRYIKKKCLSLNHKSSLVFERYILKLTPYYKGFSAVHNVKTIEQYRKMVWDFIPTILSDILTFVILFVTLSVFVSWLSVYFLIFYIVVGCVFYIYRSRLYKYLVELESSSNDVLKFRVSNASSRLNIPFVNKNVLFGKYLSTYNGSQFYEDKISNFNFYWDELTKLVSFLALFLLFIVVFFGIKTAEVNPAYMIVLFIIGSRLSSSIVQIVTRASYLKAAIFHLNKSLDSLISERLIEIKEIDSPGIIIKTLNKIKISKLSVTSDSKVILKNVSAKFHKGVIYGIKGGVGSGKSTLLKSIVGLNTEYSGKVEYDGVDLKLVDSSFFSSKVSYLNASEDQFFSGSLEDNFSIRNCNNKKTINAILKECFGSRVFDYQTMHVDDIESIAMSTGQRRKLLFMLSLLDSSELYVFDEVLVNLSKDDIVRCLLLMKEYTKNSIVILATHNESILSACDVVYEVKNNTVDLVESF